MKDNEEVRTYIRKNKDKTFRAEYRIVGPCTAPGKGKMVARIIFSIDKEHKITIKRVDSEKYQDFIMSALKTINDVNAVQLGSERMSMTMYIFKYIGRAINASEASVAEKTAPIVEDPNNVLKEI